MKGKNITSQVLKYIDDLMHTYKKLEKCIKHKDKEYKPKNIENTTVDDKINDSLTEYEAYCHYKREYSKSHKQSDLDMAHDELNHFLTAIVDAFMEMEEVSRNDMNERTLIKGKIKEIYQSFS